MQRVQTLILTSLYGCFLSAILGAVAGDEHVDGGNDKEGEEGADGHASHEHQTDGVPGFCAGAGYQGEGKVAGYGCRADHQNRAQPTQRCLVYGITFGVALFLQPVSELNDKDAVS